MPKSKLPKGVSTITEAAKARGRGGQLLKSERQGAAISPSTRPASRYKLSLIKLGRKKLKPGTPLKRAYEIGQGSDRLWRREGMRHFSPKGMLRAFDNKKLRDRMAKKLPFVGAVLGAKDIYDKLK